MAFQWTALTVTVALSATGIDAALLQRRYGFFSGGFLATNHLQGAGDAARFLAASFVSDVALAGVVVGLALCAASYLRWRPPAASFLAVASALGSLCVAEFFSYRLATYLGDAVDLSVMFELTGRRPAEFLAVGIAHLIAPLLMVTAGSAFLLSCAWAVNRYRRSGEGRGLDTVTPTPSLWTPVLLLLLGAGVTGFICLNDDVLDNGLRRKPSGKLLAALAATLTDVDQDGFGWLDHPADPDPWNSQIFPWALDIPGNGIDENGVGGDLPAGPKLTEERPGPARRWAVRPDVLLIVLESFRADLLGAMHRGQPVTPVLNGLAGRGISAQLAFSHNGYTSQSRYHIFSGSLASVRDRRSLIDDFKANGYQVAYFSAQDESFGGPALDVGFERADVAYDARVEPARRSSTFTTAGSLALPFAVLQERIGEFLTARTSRQPLLLYVNFHDTHFPYHHAGIRRILESTILRQGEIQPERAAELRAMYLNTAANVDGAVGEVLTVTRSALGVEPVVVVTADHGESLFEDAFLGHGSALNDVQTRIPLIVTGLPVVIDEPIGQAAFRNALRAALELPPGSSRSPVLRGNPDARVFQYMGTFERPRQIAFVTGGGRTIFDFRTGLVKVASTEWRHPDALTPQESSLLLALIHEWERLRLAGRQGAPGA